VVILTRNPMGSSALSCKSVLSCLLATSDLREWWKKILSTELLLFLFLSFVSTFISTNKHHYDDFSFGFHSSFFPVPHAPKNRPTETEQA
jgi:hypothetical protein